MKARFAVYSSLFVLAACSSSGDGGGTGAGGQSAGGTTAQGGTATTSTGGTGTGNNTAGTNPGGGTANNGGGGESTGGATNPAGGTSSGGTGGMMAGGGTGGDTVAGGGTGGVAVIPTTCGMPVAVSATPGNACTNSPPPAMKLTQIATANDIKAPLLLISPPGDTARQFVISRNGTIHIIKDGTLLPTPFLDISEMVPNSGGENEFGLLGLAFDPDYANTGNFWINYSNLDVDSVTASGHVSADNPDVADPASITPLFTVSEPADNHNGGMLAFGTDGCLYLGLGDGGNADDHHPTGDGNGQNTAVALGKILRMDPATGMAAPGNPGYGDPRIWMYGVRNPWRYSFDTANGDMYIGDVGQGTWEEIDVAPAGMGDINFGWNVLEGTHAFEGGPITGTRSPIVEYSHDDAQSITGGFVYRGTAIPGMTGRYLYGDYKKSRYWVLTYSGEDAGNPAICDAYEVTDSLGGAQGPTAFGQDANGELYVLTLSNGIYKIEAAP